MLAHSRPDHFARAASALVCGFLIGIAVGSHFAFDIRDISTIFLTVMCGFFVWRFLCTNRFFLLVLIFLLGGALGVLRLDAGGTHTDAALLNLLTDTTVTLYGVVDAEVDERSTHANIFLTTESIQNRNVRTRILVRTERFPEFHYGDRVRVRGKLTKPESFETDLGRTFDYPGYLRARDIYLVVPFADVVREDSGQGNPLIATLLSLKRHFMENVERALPEPSAGLAEGITLGVKRALGEDLEEAFRRTGIIHIVVLSGYNVSIVAEGIMRLLSAFFMPRTRAVVGALAIMAFAIIAGLSATVVRASIMAGLILYARTTGRTQSTLRALIFAGVIMLVANPHLLLHDPGFQLSFLATTGLITLSPIIEKRLRLIPSRFQIREFVTATLSTQLFILPFLLFLIGEFSLVSVLVNVLVLPVIPLAMLGTFLTGLFGLFGPVITIFVALPTHVLLSYVIHIAEFFGNLDFAAVSVPEFSFIYVIIMYTIFVALLYSRIAMKQRQELA